MEGEKEFADFASRLGFEYNVIEGYWSRWPESQLKELADYSRQHGVGLIVWKHSGELTDEKSVRALFDICRRNGVAGVKIDFFDHEHKEVIEQYEMILKLAAEYHLIVDFHGANKPTGLERTYPNELGVEAVYGMEKEPTARQDVTLPFTRMLAGLVDYTPTNFNPTWMADTTWAHQVANAVILQAPLLVYVAHPANILANPAADVVKSIPSVWDETVVLPVSQIGEVAAFARRKGNTWFLAVSNGPVARVVRVDLSFLGAGTYLATLIRDTGEAAAVKMEHMTLQAQRPALHRPAIGRRIRGEVRQVTYLSGSPKDENIRARRDRHILVAIHRIRHGGAFPGVPGFEVPQRGACLGIYRREAAARFAIEHKSAGRRENPRVVPLRRTDLGDLPGNRSRLDIQRPQVLHGGIFGVIEKPEAALPGLPVHTAVFDHHYVIKPVKGLYAGEYQFVAPRTAGQVLTSPALVSLLGVRMGRPLSSSPVDQVSFLTNGLPSRNLPSVRSST